MQNYLKAVTLLVWLVVFATANRYSDHCAQSVPRAHGNCRAQEKLIFYDDFDTLDTSVWKHEVCDWEEHIPFTLCTSYKKKHTCDTRFSNWKNNIHMNSWIDNVEWWWKWWISSVPQQPFRFICRERNTLLASTHDQWCAWYWCLYTLYLNGPLGWPHRWMYQQLQLRLSTHNLDRCFWEAHCEPSGVCTSRNITLILLSLWSGGSACKVTTWWLALAR